MDLFVLQTQKASSWGFRKPSYPMLHIIEAGQGRETVFHLTRNPENFGGSDKVEPESEPTLVCKPQTTPTDY